MKFKSYYFSFFNLNLSHVAYSEYYACISKRYFLVTFEKNSFRNFIRQRKFFEIFGPKLWREKSFLLHHDIAQSHSLIHTFKCLAKNSVTAFHIPSIHLIWFDPLWLRAVSSHENKKEKSRFWNDWRDLKGIAGITVGCLRKSMWNNFSVVGNKDGTGALQRMGFEGEGSLRA